ncbi:MAG: MFS transporter [Minisyncoccia bacterium]
MMNFKLNKIIKYLILSDLVFWLGWGLITPIFPIFIINSIKGGSIFVVGIAVAIYTISLAVLRIPIGFFLDRLPSEDDDYFALVLGLFIAGVLPFFFIISKLPIHIYFIQLFHGFGMALSLSGWTAIFTRHIDKGKEATQWGMDATAVSVGSGLAAFLGGFLVDKFGFNFTFLLSGIFGTIGALLLLVIKKEIKNALEDGTKTFEKNILKM